MRALLKAPGRASSSVVIPNDLRFLQDLIGGYIEDVTIGEGVVMLCDEDGKIKHLEPNFELQHDMIVGTALFVGTRGEDFTDLPDEWIDIIRTRILKEDK